MTRVNGKGLVIDTLFEEDGEVMIQNENDNEFIFWNGAGKIDVYRLYKFFAIKGIQLHYPDDKRWKKIEAVIIKQKGNIISEVNVGYLLGIAQKHIIKNTEDGAEGAIIKSLHENVKFFAEKNLKLLKKANLDFLNDDKDTAFFFFKNGVVEIKKESIKLKSYEEYDQVVWEESIIPMDFSPVSEEQLADVCDFYKFMQDIVAVDDKNHQLQREKALQSAVGYLLHRYKNPAINKAIVLMDVFVNGLPNGGSGKTLLSIALGKLRNQSIIDGKSYDQKRWFRLSTVELGTEILLFDDVKKDFDLEQVFPLMTTGMHVQRKHKDDYFIPYEKSPKVIINTNYALNGESSSFNRRIYEFEISATYNDKFTPRDKYGRNFFEEWEKSDWLLFYNTMFNCIQVYLKNDLIKSQPINIHLSKLINSTSEDFVEFANINFELKKQMDKKELFDGFLKEYPEYKYQLGQRTFTQWLRTWGDYQNYKITEGHTGSTRYIIYSEKVKP